LLLTGEIGVQRRAFVTLLGSSGSAAKSSLTRPLYPVIAIWALYNKLSASQSVPAGM
jgi:hypothetical protein